MSSSNLSGTHNDLCAQCMSPSVGRTYSFLIEVKKERVYSVYSTNEAIITSQTGLNTTTTTHIPETETKEVKDTVNL